MCTGCTRQNVEDFFLLLLGAAGIESSLVLIGCASFMAVVCFKKMVVICTLLLMHMLVPGAGAGLCHFSSTVSLLVGTNSFFFFLLFCQSWVWFDLQEELARKVPKMCLGVRHCHIKISCNVVHFWLRLFLCLSCMVNFTSCAQHSRCCTVFNNLPTEHV